MLIAYSVCRNSYNAQEITAVVTDTTDKTEPGHSLPISQLLLLFPRFSAEPQGISVDHL